MENSTDGAHFPGSSFENTVYLEIYKFTYRSEAIISGTVVINIGDPLPARHPPRKECYGLTWKEGYRMYRLHGRLGDVVKPRKMAKKKEKFIAEKPWIKLYWSAFPQLEHFSSWSSGKAEQTVSKFTCRHTSRNIWVLRKTWFSRNTGWKICKNNGKNYKNTGVF